jgi:hypothetical protein
LYIWFFIEIANDQDLVFLCFEFAEEIGEVVAKVLPGVRKGISGIPLSKKTLLLGGSRAFPLLAWCFVAHLVRRDECENPVVATRIGVVCPSSEVIASKV